MFVGETTFQGAFRGKTTVLHVCTSQQRFAQKCPLAMFVLETLWLSAKAQGPSLFIAMCLHWCINEMVKLHYKEQSCTAHQYLTGIHVSGKG